MSLLSYEAIYHHGQMQWLGEKPQLDEARVIVTVLAERGTKTIAAKHQPAASIAGKGRILGDIISPAADIEDWSCAK